MFQARMTMLILSCDKFSDLWEGHIKLLERNWPDRGVRTCIVTDCETGCCFENVEIIVEANCLEWSDRLKQALTQINTEYVFVTLDDYFLLEKVDNKKIADLVHIMDAEQIDYVRLFPHPKSATKGKLREHQKVFWIDTNVTYSVNLYSGIWKKSFLEKTTDEPRSAWLYEVRLARIARECKARCTVSHNREFVILDVVRKGKLLHKAARYFRKNPGLYNGNRKVNSWMYEIKLGIRTFGVRHAPKCIVNAARNFMIKRGHHYFSQDID